MNGDSMVTPTAGPVARCAVASTLAGAAIIHATVVGQHVEEWAPAGLFFLVLVLLESALGVLAWLAWSRLTAILVLVTSIGTLAVWAVSRTVGMPFGPADFQVPEAVGTADLVCGGLELVAAALCAFSLTPRPVAAGPGRLDHAAARAISAGGVVVSVALVTALAVAPALSGQEQHHHHDGAASRLALHR
jgi:hypothetical protein